MAGGSDSAASPDSPVEKPEDHSPPWMMIRIGSKHVECVPPLSLHPLSNSLLWQRGGGGCFGLYQGEWIWEQREKTWAWEGRTGADLLRDLSQDIRTLAQCSVQLMTAEEVADGPAVPPYPPIPKREDPEIQDLIKRATKI